MSSPLGRYSEVVTALLTIFLVVAAVAGHLFSSADLTFIDAAALLALGATYGKMSAANGYAKETRAAHRRLDIIHAPPADDGEP